MIVEPAATATYWRPSNMYVIGDAFQPAFVGKLQSGAPVIASAAINAPPSAPKMTRPVDVASVPPQDSARPGCGSSHFTAPVRMSIAFRMRCGTGSGDVRCDPPRYCFPDSQIAPSDFV